MMEYQQTSFEFYDKNLPMSFWTRKRVWRTNILCRKITRINARIERKHKD